MSFYLQFFLFLSFIFLSLFLLSEYGLYSIPLFFKKTGLLRTISKLARELEDNDGGILTIGVHNIPIKEQSMHPRLFFSYKQFYFFSL